MSNRRGYRTGYYDSSGRHICDGDRVRGIADNEIITGTVTEDDRGWFVLNDRQGGFSPDLWTFDDLEVLP